MKSASGKDRAAQVIARWKAAFSAANSKSVPPDIVESSPGWYVFSSNRCNKYRLKDLERFARRLEEQVNGH